MNRKSLYEYMTTVAISFLIAIIAVTISVFTVKSTAKKNYLKKPPVESVQDERSILISIIAKYETQVLKNPTDYKINSKLGNFYYALGDYKEAEKNYRNAVAKSTYGIYGTYFDLAEFYIKTSQLIKAEKTIKEITNKQNKAVQNAKGDFYIHLGDAYSNYEDYEVALNSYETALTIYNALKKRDKIDLASSRIIEAYDNLADKNLEKRKLTSAIEQLEKSLKYKDAPVVNYKLAILHKDIDPLKAYGYVKKTYEMDPGIINFDIYEKILVNVINLYRKNQMPTEEEFYSHKLKIIKKFKQRYLIDSSDYGIQILSYKINNHFFGNKKTVEVNFKINNNTPKDDHLLYLKIDAYYNNVEKTIYKKRLFSKEEPLKSYNESPVIKLKFSFDDSLNRDYSRNVRLDFRLTKKYNLRSTHIYTLDIPK